MKNFKKNLVIHLLAEMIFAAGFGSGFAVSNITYADDLSTQEIISMLSNNDMNVLIPMMDAEILEKTMKELPGSYSKQALVSTYLCNDPEFEGVLRDYFDN